jgi:uncharacterized protein (TIGR01777 family)
MKTIIAGGTGLIGKNLALDLARDDHQIIVLSRSPQKYGDIFPDNIQLAAWDSQSLGDWVGIIDGADAVVNLAGESISGSGFLPDRWDDEKKRRILASRKAAGHVLSEAIEIAENKPSTLLQMSAIGHYGSTGDALIDETSSSGDDFLASVTVEWEASTAAVDSMGVRRTIARTGLVLSTEDGALPRLLLPSRLFAGGWFGDGKQVWSWIHITDTVRALRFLIENQEAQGVFNVTAPEPVTNKQFGRALGSALNRPSLMPVPGFAMRLALGEVASTVLEGQRVLPQRLLEMGFSFDYPTIDAALQDLLPD